MRCDMIFNYNQLSFLTEEFTLHTHNYKLLVNRENIFWSSRRRPIDPLINTDRADGRLVSFVKSTNLNRKMLTNLIWYRIKSRKINKNTFYEKSQGSPLIKDHQIRNSFHVTSKRSLHL